MFFFQSASESAGCGISWMQRSSTSFRDIYCNNFSRIILHVNKIRPPRNDINELTGNRFHASEKVAGPFISSSRSYSSSNLQELLRLVCLVSCSFPCGCFKFNVSTTFLTAYTHFHAVPFRHIGSQVSGSTALYILFGFQFVFCYVVSTPISTSSNCIRKSFIYTGTHWEEGPFHTR